MRGLLISMVLAVAGPLTGRPADAEFDWGELLPEIRVWDAAFNLRATGGYKDNVLLSAATPRGSGFVASGVDASVLRLPIDATEFSVLLSADDRRYPDFADAEKEQTAFAATEFKQGLGDRWKVGAAAQYFYFDQVFDASTTEDPELGVIQAIGHNVSVRPGVSYRLASGWSATLEGLAAWQFYRDPLDSHHDLGGRLKLRYAPGPRSEFEVSYEIDDRPYDTRAETDPTGTPIAGTHLSYHYHRIEGSWWQKWDSERRLRTTVRLAAEINRDSGSGYYDYTRLHGSAQIRYARERWLLQGTVRLSHYDYAVQTASANSSEPRYKLTVTAGVRAEWEFLKRLRVLAEYEWDHSEGNDAADRYAANTAFGGLSFEF